MGLGCEPEVEAAYQSLKNWKRLEVVEKALKAIEAILAQQRPRQQC
jgi:hypothetical protein